MIVLRRSVLFVWVGLVMPRILYSWLMVSARPGVSGSDGWVASNAWICDFSSAQSGIACSVGLRYNPTTSISLVSKWGSVRA